MMSETSSLWLVRTSGRLFGPFTLIELKKEILQGTLDVNSEVCASLGRWKTVTATSEMADVVSVLRSRNQKLVSNTATMELLTLSKTVPSEDTETPLPPIPTVSAPKDVTPAPSVKRYKEHVLKQSSPGPVFSGVWFWIAALSLMGTVLAALVLNPLASQQLSLWTSKISLSPKRIGIADIHYAYFAGEFEYVLELADQLKEPLKAALNGGSRDVQRALLMSIQARLKLAQSDAEDLRLLSQLSVARLSPQELLWAQVLKARLDFYFERKNLAIKDLEALLNRNSSSALVLTTLGRFYETTGNTEKLQTVLKNLEPKLFGQSQNAEEREHLDEMKLLYIHSSLNRASESKDANQLRELRMRLRDMMRQTPSFQFQTALLLLKTYNSAFDIEDRDLELIQMVSQRSPDWAVHQLFSPVLDSEPLSPEAISEECKGIDVREGVKFLPLVYLKSSCLLFAKDQEGALTLLRDYVARWPQKLELRGVLAYVEALLNLLPQAKASLSFVSNRNGCRNCKFATSEICEVSKGSGVPLPTFCAEDLRFDLEFPEIASRQPLNKGQYQELLYRYPKYKRLLQRRAEF